MQPDEQHTPGHHPQEKRLGIAKDADESKVLHDEFFIRSCFATSPQKGFELLFRKYYTNLCNHTIRYVYAKDIAEDIVAEVFTNFWKNNSYETISSSYRAYLYTAVKNRAYNYIKAELNRTANTDYSTVEFQNDTNLPVLQPDQILHYHELSRKLEASIQRLPAQSRKAFQLNRLEGKKYAEIAAEMHITVSAVERLISRALTKLRDELKPEWLFLPIMIYNAWFMMHNYLPTAQIF